MISVYRVQPTIYSGQLKIVQNLPGIHRIFHILSFALMEVMVSMMNVNVEFF